MAKTPQPVGIIGLGIIGSRVAARLRAANHLVYVWNRSPRTQPNFLGSARAVAEQARILQIFVRDDEALLETVGNIASSLGPRHIVCNHATVSPAAVLEASRVVIRSGAAFLDAPFTGSKLAAEKGELSFYVGGSEEALAEARPVLEVSGKNILPCGDIGDATVLKLATNMISATTVQVLAEALAVTKASGISPNLLAEALSLNASHSPLIAAKLKAMLARDYTPHFALKNMLKDGRYALGVAEKAGLSLPVLASAVESMARMEQAGRGEEDFSVLAEQFSPSDASLV